MPSLPGYARQAVRLAKSAHELAELLEGDVRIAEPDVLVAMLGAAATGLGRSIQELADAADAAGQDAGAAKLRDALACQQESAQSLAEAAFALAAPRNVRR